MEGATTMDWTALTSALSSAFSANEILGIMGVVVTAGAGLCLAWFGGRKIVKAVYSAFSRGKLKF